jgi:hypothetical protein
VAASLIGMRGIVPGGGCVFSRFALRSGCPADRCSDRLRESMPSCLCSRPAQAGHGTGPQCGQA